MSSNRKFLSSSWRNKLRESLSPLLPFLLALDKEERRLFSENKKSIIEKYKTLSWSHLNFSFFYDLLELKLLNDLTGEDRPLFVSILGGSKTGKSFVFNRLLEKKLAPSGAATTTHSMLLYSHRCWPWDQLRDLYFPRPEPGLAPLKNPESLTDSFTHRIYCQEHENDSLKNIVLIDTPDFNREDDDNVRLAYMALALSDVVLFVFTGETYADAGGTVVARIAEECGKIIVPVYNMVDKNLFNQPARLEKDYKEKTKTPQEYGDGSISPPPYPFFPDRFFAVSWQDLRRDPDTIAQIESINFSPAGSCLEILESWGRKPKKEFLAQALPRSLTRSDELLVSLTPELEKVFGKLEDIVKKLEKISAPMEVEFPLPEAARGIYEIMEGFRPEAVNRFLSGVDKVHEKTIRVALEWIRKWIARNDITQKDPEDISEKRLRQESQLLIQACISFADSIRRSGEEYGPFLLTTLKLSHLDSRRGELELHVYEALKVDNALSDVKREMTEDMAKNPARGLLVYSDVAMRISAIAGAIILTGEGMWLNNLLWGTMGELVGQPLAKMLIERVGGARLLNRYKISRRKRYQKIIEEIIIPETVKVLHELPNRTSLEMIHNLLTEMDKASSLLLEYGY